MDRTISVLLLLVVVAAASAHTFPSLETSVTRTHLMKDTEASSLVVAAGLEAYGQDNGFYPEASSIDELAGLVDGVYIESTPRADGWRRPLEYRCWQVDPESAGCDSYALASPGRDAVLDYPDLREYPEGETRTHDFDADIVYRDGAFAVYPDF